MVKQWRSEFTHDEGGVFKAIDHKDSLFFNLLLPWLNRHPTSRAWYLIAIGPEKVILQITLKDDAEAGTGNNKESRQG